MKNAYEIRGEVTVIFLNSRKHGQIETLIDTKDLERVKSLKGSWYADFTARDRSFCYVKINLSQKKGEKATKIRMHRFILGISDEYAIDHINHNTLDNRSSNLRGVTIQQNNQNKSTNQNSKSGFRGVVWSEKFQVWMVKMKVNKKQMKFGRYKNLNDAVSAAIEARKKYMPYSDEAIS